MKRPSKTARADGLGHWPRGKRRSTLTDAERERIIAKLRKAILPQYYGSMLQVALAMQVSDRTIGRILSGEDHPSERIRERVARLAL